MKKNKSTIQARNMKKNNKETGWIDDTGSPIRRWPQDEIKEIKKTPFTT